MRIMKLLLIGLVFLVSVSMTYAVPEIAYTNFARTTNGNLVLNSTVDVRITITNSGSTLYQEIHNDVPTNGYGLFTVKLGTGAPVGADTYNGIIAVSTLNVQAETDAGQGYRFIQLSPLLNTALKNEEAAGIVTLNDAYANGDSIEVLPGAPVKLVGTGLIQSDATIAAINANGNKTLTTKQYVDAADALIQSNPFLVWEPAGADLPNAKVLNGETNVINFNAATANLSILNDGISEPKLKMANNPSNGYIIKWNGTDMTWADPTVITAHPVVGDGTVGNPITLYKTGVNANDVLFYNGTQWTNGQVTSAMIADGTIANGDINNATEFVSVTGEAGTPFAITNGNRVLDFQGTGSTTVTLNQATHTVYIEAGIVADIPLSGVGSSSDHLKINYDATLDLNGNSLSINTGNSNTWTADQLLNATAAQGNNLVAALNLANNQSLNGDVVNYDATLKVTANELGFDLAHSNTWTANQLLPATLAQGNNLVDAANMATNQRLNGDVVNYDATLKVTANELGLDLAHANSWTALQTFSSVDINGGTIDATVIGATTPAAGTFTTLVVNTTANVGTDLTVGGLTTTNTLDVITDATVGNDLAVVNDLGVGNDVQIGNNLEVFGNTKTGSLDVDVDANVGGNLVVTGTTTSALFIGETNFDIQDGAGIADFTFNNLGDAIVAVDYDATLKIDGSDKLGLDLAHANSWTALQTFSSVDINGGTIDATVIGGTTPAAATFTTLVVNTTADIGTDLTVGGNTLTNTLDVTTDAFVGNDLAVVNDLGVGNNAQIGNDLEVFGTTTTNELVVNFNASVGSDLTVGGNTTTGGVFVGQLNHSVTGGAGLANVTFDNLADVTFAVNVAAPVIISGDDVTLAYDATLDMNGSDLSINTGNENIWTANQLLNATAAQGDNLVAAINLAADKTLEADVLMYDATLEVNSNELGLNHDYQNIWLTTQTFAPTNDEMAVILDGTAAANNPTFVAVGNGVSGDFDFIFEGDFDILGSINLSADVTVGGVTTTNTLDVTTNATIGNDLDVTGNTTTGSLDVTNNATVGGDLDVTGNTNMAANVTIGSDNTDLVVFNALVDSDIIPDEDNVHNLGSSTLRWNDLYLGPGTLHIGTNGDEGTMAYDLLNNEFDFNQNINVTGNGNFTGSLNVDVNATIGADLDVTGTVTAGTLNGGFADGSILFADASGNITEDNATFNWDNTNNTLNLDGNISIVGGSVDPELMISGGQGIFLNTGATLTIEDYTYPNAAGAATEFMALNATADQLEWWNYDNTILVDPLNKTIGVDMSAPFTFTNLVAFNPASGSAISASSSDPSAPTVTIAHTDPLGVALELVGQNEETTALEITTGGLNIGAGQFIVSSNSGVTGAQPDGPSITINNNGDTGANENGGALQILIGHTAFSYNNYTPANNANVDLSGEAYTVLDITSLGTNAVTLPGSSMAADNLGTIIYVINSGAGTLTLPGGLGNVAAGSSVQLVYTAAGWFKLN